MTSQFYARSGPIAPPAIDPERQRLHALRTQIEAELERMIDLLNAIDGDPDFEPEEDDDTTDYEPSLGWSISGATTWQDGSLSLLDLEEEHDGREPDEDFEGNTDDNGLGDRCGLVEQYGERAFEVGFYRPGIIAGQYVVEPHHCWTEAPGASHD
jgi:hypothetical protein